MRVLYVNHTAEVSGGEHSLLSLLAALPAEVQPLLATPPGDLSRAAQRIGIPTTEITGTAGSLRLHPLHTPQAVIEMARAARQVRRAAASHRAELVHGNSIRSGIVLALARLAPLPTVVHVRDCLPPGALSVATLRLIAASATIVVANSRYTADSVRALAPRARLEVVYNAVDLRRFDPALLDRARTRTQLDVAGGRLLLGVVAQLSPWKGQRTAVQALRLALDEGIDAHLLLIGSAKFLARATRFDNRGYVTELRELIAREGLEDRVSWLGEREDVPELIRALDILLMPSSEEPFGRALIEAMALGVAVIATDVGGPPEIIEDRREGLLVRPDDPPAWAEAIRRLAGGTEARAELGRAGRRRVEQAFTVDRQAADVLAVYERAVVAARGKRPLPGTL